MNLPKHQRHLARSTSATLAINELVKTLWSEGRNIFHLAFGESRMPLHPRLVASLREHICKKSYLESVGLSDLRESIAAFHQRHWNLPVDADQIIVGPGSKALFFGIMLAVECDVFLPTPSWVSYAPQAELAGRAYTYLPGSFDDGYELSVEALEATVDQNGTALPLLVLNSPNNPSGKVFSESKLQELAEFCRSRQIIVLSDEIYALTTFDGQRHRSIAQYYPEGTIVIGGPSKHLSLGGWRLGAAIVPDSTLGNMTKAVLKTVASEIWSSPTSGIQYVAIAAYADDAEVSNYIQACTDLHELKTRLLARSFKQIGIRCTDPAGAYYFIANFDSFRESLGLLGIETSDELASHLLIQHEIATLPGTAFGIPNNELSLRIASSYIDMETDEKAENLMSTFLANERSLKTSDLSNSFLLLEHMKAFVQSLQPV